MVIKLINMVMLFSDMDGDQCSEKQLNILMKDDKHLQLQRGSKHLFFLRCGAAGAKLRWEEQGQAVREDHDGANLGRWSSQWGTWAPRTSWQDNQRKKKNRKA